MAAKSLDEAIRNAMCFGKIADFPQRMHSELRDFMSHEIMKVLGTKPTEGETKILYAFFKKVIEG